MELKNVIVYNAVGNSSCMTEDDGLIVYDLINRTLQKNIAVQLDFQHIEIYTPAFLNASIGMLYKYYDSQFIRDNLSIVNMLPEDMALLKLIVNNAKLFYDDTARLQKSIDVILSN